MAARMAVDGIDAAVMSDVRVAASVSPLPAIEESDANGESNIPATVDGLD
jgi:hypothetical protein